LLHQKKNAGAQVFREFSSFQDKRRNTIRLLLRERIMSILLRGRNQAKMLFSAHVLPACGCHIRQAVHVQVRQLSTEPHSSSTDEVKTGGAAFNLHIEKVIQQHSQLREEQANIHTSTLSSGSCGASRPASVRAFKFDPARQRFSSCAASSKESDLAFHLIPPSMDVEAAAREERRRRWQDQDLDFLSS
jgi:hypothetical protein